MNQFTPKNMGNLMNAYESKKRFRDDINISSLATFQGSEISAIHWDPTKIFKKFNIPSNQEKIEALERSLNKELLRLDQKMGKILMGKNSTNQSSH